MKAIRSMKTGGEVVAIFVGALLATGLGIAAGIGCFIFVYLTKDRAW